MQAKASSQTSRKTPVRIAVTGAGGQIAYSLLFRLISGELFGPDQPIILQLGELPMAMEKLKGVAMELEDSASSVLVGLELACENEKIFKDAQIIIMLGSKPRGPGMERKDLLLDNGKSFAEQGAAINAVASRDVKVLVVGNPANTNAMTACNAAPDIDDSQFTALIRLDQNRLTAQLALNLQCETSNLQNVLVWGNHSSTMVPDISHATLEDKAKISDKIDSQVFRKKILPSVQQRGAAIIKARGLSSAASTAQAIIDQLRGWVFGTKEGEFVSMSVISNGEYGVTPGLCFGYPVTCKKGNWQIVEGLEFNELTQSMFKATEQELLEEKQIIESALN